MNKDNNVHTGSGVQAVETSIAILEALKRMEGGKVTAIGEETGLSKGAVYKHLSTLTNHGFVVKNGSEYELGFRFLDYGGWLRSRYVGSEIIKPRVRELAEETNEVALFSILEGGRAITLFRENGTQGVFTRTRLGRRLYPNQNAAGKAILSQLPESAVRSHIDDVGLPEATEKTITDEAELLAELEQIRERGYALNREESTDGLVAVAVPVVPEETVIGACSVAGPRHRMDDEYLKADVVEMLLSVVNEVELNIAHSQESVSRFGSR
ncbi:IclR family transcriptional regulator [Natrinema zhouii]|uniref:IclR family transcriptional regulator n=1 Tax=Natrinema zhouii TaxID=1710539 RepID=A0A7D6CSV8_9EURY|nr:IclR family transcriptional regulator [Natrinema zhouii]QLK27270.1 IclR family transcriptional regulator [Natrinema zhouii]